MTYKYLVHIQLFFWFDHNLCTCYVFRITVWASTYVCHGKTNVSHSSLKTRKRWKLQMDTGILFGCLIFSWEMRSVPQCTVLWGLTDCWKSTALDTSGLLSSRYSYMCVCACVCVHVHGGSKVKSSFQKHVLVWYLQHLYAFKQQYIYIDLCNKWASYERDEHKLCWVYSINELSLTNQG